MNPGILAAEQGWLPDWTVRVGIRALLRQRLRQQAATDDDQTAESRLLTAMRAAPIALEPTAANTQHYEVPARFFELVLGPRLKYSCCLWPAGTTTLAEAEETALRVTGARAEVEDGMRILDLGCGWGAGALWLAETFPSAEVVAVSNSHRQRDWIEHSRRQRGYRHLQVLTADMNTFEPSGQFDRVVSVEMFEHMRNYRRLLSRINRWLKPGGKLFVHHFCHRRFGYFFEDAGSGDWMARHFFTGGMMPSRDLLRRVDHPLEVEAHWSVSGREYQRTAQAWLANLDRHRAEVEEVLVAASGRTSAAPDAERWRLFFLACAELFGFRRGEEWLVSHYRLRRTEG